MSRILRCLTMLALLPAPLAGQEPVAIDVTPATASVVAGETIRFTAVAKDAQGRTIPDAPITWLATPFDVAGADPDGRVTTARPGRVSVLALAGPAHGVAVLEIRERPATRLEVSALGSPEVVVGDLLRLEVEGYTELGDPVPVEGVRWRSESPQVASVDPGGVVTGRSPGTATITATATGLSGGLEVAVRANRVVEIEVSAPDGPVREGDVVRLSAAARDDRGEAVSDAPLRWSVRGAGASVDEGGYFVAEEPGAYTVVASVGDAAGGAGVRVVPRADRRGLEAVAHVPLPAGVQAAEIWPVGDVAYVSTIDSRVYVFDISDPGAPRLADSLVVDARLINDVSTTADGRIGVLAREGASTRRNGIVVFDASDPLHPEVVSEFHEGMTGGVHSAFVYEHYVFATDDATGSLRIVDIADPRSPRQVARWEIPRDARAHQVLFLNVSPQRYLHDVFVKDGLAYLAYWRDGLVILDVGNGVKGGSITEPVLVSQYAYNHAELYPPDYIAGTHAVFREGDRVYIGDESYPGTMDLFARDAFPTRGIVQVLDVSDIERPKHLATYDPVEFGAHNLWVRDDLLYVGAYDGGIRVLDVGGELRGDLREQGRLIGSVYTGSLDGFRPNQALAWSAIPHGGHIFASDINTGLWVARVTGAPVP